MTSPTKLPPRRILIMGNSGSGKSTLAAKLAHEHQLAHLDLDTLAWQPDKPTQRQSLQLAQLGIEAFTRGANRWVVEGCYADLLELLSEHATELIFLDLPVATCQAHARARPWEPHKYASKEAQDAKLEMLLEWIAEYPERDGALGRAAHVGLFEAFVGERRRVEG